MNLNIIPNGAIKRVHVSQNDVGRTLTFELFNNSTSYTIPSGATVKIQGTKPSGLGFSETCTVSGNTVTIDTTEEMTDEFGYIEAELQITNSGDVLGTSNFVLVVEKNPHPSNTTDGTQITAQSLEVRIEALEESALGGLTDEVKQALLDCFEHVAWIDEHGQDYYDALEDALYPPADLVSISAVYTQSGTVYDTDTLDSLKTDLVVTAHYDDSTTATVTSYTLSGTLTVGTSTITVTYGGKTTTFNVTVTQAYSITNNLTNCTSSNNATGIASGGSYSATLTETSGYELSSVTVTMGGSDVTSTVYSNGTITIASVSGDIVITAIALVGALYKLSSPITFDGTVSPINTNVILQPSGNTDVDWTIAFEFTESESISTSSYIFDFGWSSNWSDHFAFFYYMNNRNKWVGSFAGGTPLASWASAHFGDTERYVITHTAGVENPTVYAKRGSNAIESAVATRAYNHSVGQSAQSVPVIIGDSYDNSNQISGNNIASGITLNNFRIYNEVWDSDTINDFLTNGVN